MSETDPHVALCAGCAQETGLADEQHAQAPPRGDQDMGCQHCGATITAFWYAVPENAYNGMVPGPG